MFKSRIFVTLCFLTVAFSAPQISSSIQGLCPGSGADATKAINKIGQRIANYNGGVSAGTSTGVLNGANAAADIQAIAQAFGQGLSSRELEELFTEEELAEVRELLAPPRGGSCQIS